MRCGHVVCQANICMALLVPGAALGSECSLKGLCEPSETHLSGRQSHRLTACHREASSWFHFISSFGWDVSFLFITSSLQNVEPFMKSLITVLVVSRYCFTLVKGKDNTWLLTGGTLSNNITHLLRVSGSLCCKKMFGFWVFL